MGTNFNGKKPQNRITISRGGNVAARKIDPENHITDRSFAQPNPSLPQKEVVENPPATAQDEAEALRQNSTEGRDYGVDDSE